MSGVQASLFKLCVALRQLCLHNEALGALQWWGVLPGMVPTLFLDNLRCECCIIECALRQGGYLYENDFYLCCEVCIIIHCTAGSLVDSTPWEEVWRGIVLQSVSNRHISVML